MTGATIQSTTTKRGWLLLVVVALAMLLQPLTSFAQATEEPASPTTVVEVAAAEVTEDTATEVPTDEPAETPIATATLEPTQAATETAVPTETPSGTETATPTETVEPSPETPEATATESAGAGKTSRVSTAEIASAESKTSCSSGTNGGVVTPDDYITFTCTAEKTPFKLFVAQISANWAWAHSFTAGVAPSTWSEQFNVSTEAGGNSSVIYVFFRPTSKAAIGSTASLNITIERTNGENQGSFLLTGVRKPEATHFQSWCSPDFATVPTSGTGTVTCTVKGTNLAGNAAVEVSNLTVSAPAGWTVTPDKTSGTLTGLTHFTVTLSLTPVCGAPVAPQAPNVAVNATLTFQSAPSFPAPTATLTAVHGATSTVSAVILSSDLDWARSYSFASQLVNGSMTYRVTASGCAGWNIQISATEFAYTGSAEGAPIASSNIAVIPGPVTPVTGSTANLTPGSAGILASSIKVLSAAESFGIGTYDQTLGLSVTIPGAARVGTYSATITITAASGP